MGGESDVMRDELVRMNGDEIVTRGVDLGDEEGYLESELLFEMYLQ